MRTRLILGVLGVALWALSATGAEAAVCKLRSSSGTCLFWSGSVEGALITDTTVHKGDSAAVTATPIFLSGAGQISPSGMILCKNQGNNVSPGIQALFVSSGYNIVQTGTSSSFTKNGNITTTTVIANQADQAALNALAAQWCPNGNWKIIDTVPCSASIASSIADESATFACTLDYPPTSSCQTLQWTITGKGSASFERRQYNAIDPGTQLGTANACGTQ